MESLDHFRQQLPVYNFKNHIINALQKKEVTIIAGETGSGKTTQIPQYIYEQNKNQNIIITQPRRVAAITIAQRVAQEKNCKIGELVGYSVRFDDKYSNDTKIKYVTDGMLIRELISDSSLKQYTTVIIDEAHERTIQSDLLLALLKDLILKRKNLNIIIMSATLEIEKIANYFNTKNIIEIKGRTFPIEVYNTEMRQNDYIESTLDTILQVHFNEQDDGDILAFLPGQEDIEDLSQVLLDRTKLFPSHSRQLIVRNLYSALPPDIQMQAFEKTPLNHRKVVLSTNIAETSVTIDGIKFVIDSGLVKIRQFQHQKAIETLLTVPISQAQAMQRAGRAGRQTKGKCYRLYTKESFFMLGKFMLPEILRSNLQQVVLQMKAIGIKNILKFDFLDQPDVLQILQSMDQLKKLKALDEEYNLTEHGKNMSLLPLQPQYSNLLLKALEFGVLEVALDVVSMLEINNLFYIPRNSKVNIQKILQKFKVATSDHLTKSKILQQYLGAKNKKSFCSENFINQKSVKKAIEIRTQLNDYITIIKKKQKNQMQLEINEPNKIFIECLQESMIFKQAYYSPSDQTYRICGSNQLAYIHPESTLFELKKKPEYLVYNEVIMTRKVYMRDITEISNIKSSTQ